MVGDDRRGAPLHRSILYGVTGNQADKQPQRHLFASSGMTSE